MDGWTASTVREVFPFHFVLDRELVLRDVAPRMREVWPELAPGAAVAEVLELERPAGAWSFDALVDRPRELFLLRARGGGGPLLRGQLLRPEAPDRALFVGWPWVTSIAQLAEHRLTLADFPPHSAHAELLLLIQTQQLSLADARSLADRLRKVAQGLRIRNTDLEHEIVRSERLASLGRLVAGVAHEINTPLGVAVTAASLVREELARLGRGAHDGTLTRGNLRGFLSEASQSVEILESNLARAKELIASFKRVAVDQASWERRRLDLVAYVREVVASLQPVLRRGQIECTVEGPIDLSFETYPGALSQIITNIVTNAAQHAYEPEQPGSLKIALAREDDGGASITCADGGRGVPRELLHRIFEPFFTTRRQAGGSGLGMHIVHNLATEVLGGSIRAESPPGGGLRVAIRLPPSPGERRRAS